MASRPQAPEQRARRAAVLNYFSLFGSFSTLHLLCAAVGARPFRNGDHGGLSVVGSSVACQLISAQDMDVQHRRDADCADLPRDVPYRATSPSGRSLQCGRPNDLR